MIAGWIRRTAGGLPRLFWFLWVGTLINRIGLFVMPFLTLFLTGERGVPAEQATLMVSLYGLGSFTAQVSGGYFADRWGRRPTMLASLLVTPFVLITLSQLTSLAAIGLTTAVLGFFTDLYRPASSALVADVVPPEQRLRAFSLRYWAINLGAAIALALGGWLATQNYMLLFIGDAVTTLGFGLVTLIALPETRPSSSSPADALRVRLTPSLGDPVLLFALAFVTLQVLVGSVYMQANATMPLVMRNQGLTEADYGSVLALNGVVIVLVSLSVNQALSGLRPLTLMALNALLIAIGFGLYLLAGLPGAGTPLLYAGGVVLWTLGELIGSPIAPALLADLSPTHQRGFYQGLLGAAYGLSAFVGPLLGGLVYASAGEGALWGACLVVGAVVAVVQVAIMQPVLTRLRARQASEVVGMG